MMMRRRCLSNPTFEDTYPTFIPTPLISRVLLYKKNINDLPADDPSPIRLIDKALCTQLGYEQRELVGRSFVDLVYDLAEERESIREVVMNHTENRKTTFLVSKNGERKGPYTLDFLLVRAKNCTFDASRRQRPCITINVVSCTNRAILFKLQDFFINSNNNDDDDNEKGMANYRSASRKTSARPSTKSKQISGQPVSAAANTGSTFSFNGGLSYSGPMLSSVPTNLPSLGTLSLPPDLPPPPHLLPIQAPQVLHFPVPLGPNLPMTSTGPLPPSLLPQFCPGFQRNFLSGLNFPPFPQPQATQSTVVQNDTTQVSPPNERNCPRRFSK